MFYYNHEIQIRGKFPTATFSVIKLSLLLALNSPYFKKNALGIMFISNFLIYNFLRNYLNEFLMCYVKNEPYDSISSSEVKLSI